MFADRLPSFHSLLLVISILPCIASSVCADEFPPGYDLIRDEGTDENRRGAINFIGAGVSVADDSANNESEVTIAGGGSTNSFETLDTPLGSDPVADSATDTLTLTSTGPIVISGTASTDTIAWNLNDSSLTEVMLKVVDAAADEECLTYETAVGDFEWQTCGGGGNSFETWSVPAGTNPVADSSTDTVTFTASGVIVTGTAGSDTIDFTVETQLQEITGDVLVTSAGVATIQPNAVALTTDTTGNYAAGDAEAGAALTGDSATSFFSTGTLEVSIGGTGATTLTDGGILLGSGTAAITALGVATNGQLPIGDGTTDPVLATLTGTTDEITVTNGVGTITLDIPDPLIVGKGGSGAATFTDGGILLGSGTGAFTALGVATNGQIPVGDGTTDPVLATLTGTTDEITVTNGAGTITLDIPDPLIVGKGGTGAASLTDGGILLGSGTGAVTALGVATNGQLPIGDGTTDPVLAALTEGTALDVTNGVGSITIAFDATEVEATTWGAGGNASNQWTYNLSANDPDLTAGSAAFTLSSAASNLTLNLGENTVSGLLVWYAELGGTDYTMTMQPGTQTQNIRYVWPPNDGTTDQVLTSDGGGVLTWTSAASGGDSILIVGVAVTDASGVDLIGGTNGIDIAFDAGVSPDTATFNFDSTEVGTTTWGSGTSFTWTFNAGDTDPTVVFGNALVTWDQAHDFGGASSVEIPNGTAPTVNAAGEIAVDTTSGVIVAYDGTAVRVFGYEEVKCATIENLVGTDDNILIFSTLRNVTVTQTHCTTSAFTTQPTLLFEDDGGNAMTGAATCAGAPFGGGWTAVSAGGGLIGGEGMRFDTTNTTAPTTGTQALICFAFTTDRP